MPLYEYKCEVCGATFEVIQRFSDPPIETCRTCGGPVQKVLSAPAIQFKGSGWYVTDYGKSGGNGGNGKKPEKAEPEAKGTETSGSKASADSSAGSSASSPSSNTSSK